MTANGPERFPAGDDGDVGRSEDAGGSGFSATGGPGGGPADGGGEGGGGEGGGQGGGSAGTGPPGGGPPGGGPPGGGPPGGGPPGGGPGGEGYGDEDPIDGEDLDDLDDDDEDYDSEAPATFRPIPGGAACYFEPAQAGVIRSLVMQVAELISDSATSGLGAGDPAGGGGPAPGTGIAPGAGPEAGADAGADAGLGEGAGSGGPADEDSPDELEMLLGLSANAELPDDPVLARLLPDAYSDDPQASAEFRRYTEESLRSSKINSAQAVLASLPAGGGDVVLSEPECQQWLRSLNDVRLALGVRLGITEEDEDLTENLSVNDPRSAYIWVYQWLAYLQDSLIESLG